MTTDDRDCVAARQCDSKCEQRGGAAPIAAGRRLTRMIQVGYTYTVRLTVDSLLLFSSDFLKTIVLYRTISPNYGTKRTIMRITIVYRTWGKIIVLVR